MTHLTSKLTKEILLKQSKIFHFQKVLVFLTQAGYENVMYKMKNKSKRFDRLCNYFILTT